MSTIIPVFFLTPTYEYECPNIVIKIFVTFINYKVSTNIVNTSISVIVKPQFFSYSFLVNPIIL